MVDKLKLGLIIDPEFYMLEKSVSAVALPLVRAYCDYFNTRILYDQQTYDRLCLKMDFLVSWEPKWAAPIIKWNKAGLFHRTRPLGPCYVMMSDPHQNLWRQDYFLKQKLDYILALYDRPTRQHFTRIPSDRIFHFPWAIPDDWITYDQIIFKGQTDVAIFGAAKDEAYTLRNWCREQPGVQSYSYSGVENKIWSDSSYFEWLGRFDAVIAAGSEDPKYRLTTPKYFEIAAAGCLLFAQQTDDLEILGFKDRVNCLVFTQATFSTLLEEYLADPANLKWLNIRNAGRELIRARHTISVRLHGLEEHVRRWKGR